MKVDPEQRVVRVFVSSTFRDMAHEREELVKHIFPELQSRLAKRRVGFVGVDLRWGITEEEAERGDVLSICLKEIERSYPYFVCLLGGKYGWIPDILEGRLLEEHAWLKELSGKSVTEMEILHGALNKVIKEKYTFFYFRSENASKQVEEELSITPGYQAEPPGAQIKLEALKETIRKSGYNVRENYPDSKTVGQWILEDLSKTLDEQFPEEDVPTALELQRLEHEAFAAARTKVYIGKKEYFDRLDEHVNDTGSPLVLTGESGSGKSALIANWAKAYQEKNPHDFMIKNFIGSTPDSADYTLVLRRIIEEIRERLSSSKSETTTDESLSRAEKKSAKETARQSDEDDEIPTDPEKLVEALPLWLAKLKGEKLVILVIDAVNQLWDRDNALDLGWLPENYPRNVRLILSTLPGRCLDAIKKRQWDLYSVLPMENDEIKRFVSDYLTQYGKRLNAEQVDSIASAKQSANPLFLRTLMEELRIFGVFEQLSERIEYYMQAGSVDELFTKVLERMENDYERDRPGLTRDVMSLLWASRRGLSEGELLDLLGAEHEPLPHAHWSGLYLALVESLVNRSGLFTFFHDFLRTAVRKRYLENSEQKDKTRMAIADYFESIDLSERKVEELPWQLIRIKQWDRLYNQLADLQFFTTLWDKNQFEAKTYWTTLENNSSLSMIDAYRDVTREPERFADHVWSVSSLFTDTGHISEAAPMLEYLVEYYRKTEDLTNLSGALGNLANLLYSRGDLDRAMTLYKEAEKIGVDSGDDNGIQRAIGNQALIFQTRGDLEKAMELYMEKERICRVLGAKDGVQRAVGNQAVILQSRGDLNGAMTLLKEKERICRELGDMNELQLAIGNQAVILQSGGDYESALELYKEAERISRELGNKDGIQRALGNQAVVFMERGDLDEAMRLQKESENICRDTGNIDGLQHSLGNQSVILMERGALKEAMKLSKEKERICRELGNKNELQRALGNQAAILTQLGELDEAVSLHRQEELICRELGNSGDLLISLSNQAIIQRRQGNPDAAMTLHSEEERICREIGSDNELQASLINQATILMERDELDEAMELLKESERLNRNMDTRDGLQLSLSHQAMILRRQGALDEAISLLEQEERICREIGNMESLSVCFGNQAMTLQAKGELKKALELYGDEERICRELGDKDELHRTLGDQAVILQSFGKHDEALKFYKEAGRISREMDNKDGIQRSLGNQAVIFMERGDLDEAMRLHKEAEYICRDIDAKDGLQRSLGNQAVILTLLGDLDEAISLHQQEELICRELGNSSDLLISLSNQAIIQRRQGNPDAAMTLHSEEERICREIGSDNELQASLINQATILMERDELDEAMELLKESERLNRNMDTRNGLQLSLSHQAMILRRQGALDEAMVLLEQEERICREIGNMESLSVCFGNQAMTLQAKGELNEAITMFREKENICRSENFNEGLAIALFNQATLLIKSKDRRREALPLAEEAYEVAEQSGLSPISAQIEPLLNFLKSKPS